ncbi:hypothetical protein FHG87_005774 [Trinorchestia longiramus]|nr:hypothetical protein FHG87_005774 [Trinorchestia longiramus]
MKASIFLMLALVAVVSSYNSFEKVELQPYAHSPTNMKMKQSFEVTVALFCFSFLMASYFEISEWTT